MALFAGSEFAWILLVQWLPAIAVVLALLLAGCGVVAVRRLLPVSLPDGGRQLVDEEYLKNLAALYDLSPRETQVFLLLAQGRNRPFIQEELGISDGTVKTHASRIYQKFGVGGKQQLISAVFDGAGPD